MKHNFDTIAYRGPMRDEQKSLLRRMYHSAEKDKMHIVAPPGSDKRMLGWELLRHIGAPAMILTGSETLCKQWRDRFADSFLRANERTQLDAYVSLTMDSPALVTVITYDTFASAFSQTGSRMESVGGETRQDVVRYVYACGIQTVLLDDPHHIGEDVFGTLESFFGVLGHTVRMLTLNSVLPYDNEAWEWTRFTALCGEVDAEICLTDMVRSGVICPHQDYVQVHYPTDGESDEILDYRRRVDTAVREIMQLPFAAEIADRLIMLFQQRRDYPELHRSALGALLCLLADHGHVVRRGLVKTIYGQNRLPILTPLLAEEALGFLLESHSVLRADERTAIRVKLEAYRVFENRRACLTMTDDVRRMLISSAGKMAGVAEIVQREHASDGERQRTLILADAWCSEKMRLIGTGQEPEGCGMIEIFEMLRRRFTEIPIGCVSATGTILPTEAAHTLSRATGDTFHATPIGSTGYALYRFADSEMRSKVVQSALAGGHIRVLIGGADDILEWWGDLSVVRTLIIASHQMNFTTMFEVRGRVLRASAQDPNKTAHIWHLATVERMHRWYEDATIRLATRMKPGDRGRGDFELETLRRYFICFVGPNKTGSGLVSGIDRLGALYPPKEAGDRDITDRAVLSQQWRHILRMETTEMPSGKSRDEQMHRIPEVYVPKTAKMPICTPAYVIGIPLAIAAIVCCLLSIQFVLEFTYIMWILQPISIYFVILLPIVDIGAMLWGIVFILHYLPLFFPHLTPRNSIRVRCKALFKAMKTLKLIDKNAVFVMRTASNRQGYRVSIQAANITQQIAFQKAVTELFSEIRQPRYLMVRAGLGRRLLWHWSCACPAVIGKNDIAVKVFSRYIRWTMGGIKFQYTHCERGQMYLFFAHNCSYLNARRVRCVRRVRPLWIAVKASKRKARRDR